MSRRTRPGLALLAVAAAAALATAVIGSGTATGATSTSHPVAKKPSHVLIVLFDQMRPEYADRFGMTNFQSIRDSGANFRKAYLGYMGSETVISHNVIVSGQTPKHMGWVDEAYRDHNNLLGSGNDAMWITGDLKIDQFQTLVQDANYPKLSDYLHAAYPGSKFITVGEKSYAVDSATAGTGDIGVRMSDRSTTSAACVTEVGGAYRFPIGRDVPGYLLDDCGRFYINSDKANDYGTTSGPPSWLYPEDGNRFFPGFDPDHLGGDVWVADAAMAMMENETDWSGMFVTLGGIDKAGHMWGADQDVQPPPGTLGEQTHVEAAAKVADEQLGLMLQKLDDLGQLDDTLVVLTADHGATHGKAFYGQDFLNAGNTNWYYGAAANGSYLNPSPALKPLIDTGNVQFSYQSTSIQTWLVDNSPSKLAEAAAVMKTLPGVIASYYRDGGCYRLTGVNQMTRSERAWWRRHGQEIVNTMAADNGPDVVGLLHDDTSYGVYGDHGGATQEVQQVPMVFWTSSMRYGTSRDDRFRTYDLMPTVLRAMGIPQTAPTDGRGVSLR